MNLLELVVARRPELKTWKGQPFKFIEQKMDGWRITIAKEDGDIRAVGRKTRIDLWPMMSRNAAIRDLVRGLPDGTVLDGEAWSPHHPASSVPTLLRRGEDYHFSPFAMPYLSGRNLMHDHIDEVCAHMFPLGIKPPLRVPFLDHPDPKSQEELLLERVVYLGWEGFVLKADHYSCWYKLKPKPTVDVVITGYLVSESDTHKGKLGSLEGSVYKDGRLTPITNIGKGFKKHEREWTSKDTLGRVCEVSYEGVQSKGMLRFSSFERWRDDKPSEECTMDQLSQ